MLCAGQQCESKNGAGGNKGKITGFSRFFSRYTAPLPVTSGFNHPSQIPGLYPGFDYLCRMEVNDELIDKLSHLSRLEFSATEKLSIRQDLERMIGFVEKLNELNLDRVEPLLHMSGEVNVLRDDEVKGSVSRDEALQNAPLHDKQFFQVPKVIKK